MKASQSASHGASKHIPAAVALPGPSHTPHFAFSNAHTVKPICCQAMRHTNSRTRLGPPALENSAILGFSMGDHIMWSPVRIPQNTMCLFSCRGMPRTGTADLVGVPPSTPIQQGYRAVLERDDPRLTQCLGLRSSPRVWALCLPPSVNEPNGVISWRVPPSLHAGHSVLWWVGLESGELGNARGRQQPNSRCWPACPMFLLLSRVCHFGGVMYMQSIPQSDT